MSSPTGHLPRDGAANATATPRRRATAAPRGTPRGRGHGGRGGDFAGPVGGANERGRGLLGHVGGVPARGKGVPAHGEDVPTRGGDLSRRGGGTFSVNPTPASINQTPVPINNTPIPASNTPGPVVLHPLNFPQPPMPGPQRRKRVAADALIVDAAVKPWAMMTENATKRRFTSSDLQLLKTGDFSDASVICGDKTWKVHKMILATRSTWFKQAFTPDENGLVGDVNLRDQTEEDVGMMLRFIYTGELDKDKYTVGKGSFCMYANLFIIGQTFNLENLRADALSLLGQFCDAKLQQLCGYEVAESGRSGVVGESSNPFAYISDLIHAIYSAYANGLLGTSTELQVLLCTFVWAGRNRLLQNEHFKELADKVPQFCVDMFKLMLGGKTDSDPHFTPIPFAIQQVSTGIDHTHKSQHPDRCGHCHGVFNDNTKTKKAMYNPFLVTARPVTYCEPCVEKTKDTKVPLWRIEPQPMKEAREN